MHTFCWLKGKLTRLPDPATSEIVSTLPDLDESSCYAAVESAVAVSPLLASLAGRERASILNRWYELVIEAKEDLAAIITAENGKILAEARGEVMYAADFLHWFAGEAPRIDGTVRDLISLVSYATAEC